MIKVRHFFHSFPRPKRDESANDTLDRGLKILTFMKQVGLILAPEVVHWDVSVLAPDAPQVHLLQCRASFTELAISELARHSKTFGPICWRSILRGSEKSELLQSYMFPKERPTTHTA
jgi:hypothetical protein